MARDFKKSVGSILEGTGIVLNGQNPWDPQIRDQRFYGRVLSEGSLGLGESYMDGWWECQELDQFFYRILKIDVRAKVRDAWPAVIEAFFGRIINLQSRERAFEIGEAHYDLGNDLYRAMLDRRMVYTCGYWKNATTLDEAQEAKLDLICKKLRLQKGQNILDIGCGWGSFLKFAAERYGIHGVGVTVSAEQAKLAEAECAALPIEIRLQDYRDVTGTFDHIVSLGMFEHVGYKNYRTFMEVVSRCLKDDGLFLLHTIGGRASVKGFDPWIGKYIFPNSMLPSVAQIGRAAENLFVVEDLHSFGADYDKTLMAWHENFKKNWPSLASKYDERFERMWRYYLLACAGSFRARVNQLWQLVLSKNGVSGGYESVR